MKNFGFLIFDFGFRTIRQTKNQVPNSKILLTLALVFSAYNSSSADVDYSRDIKPLLADNCYKCHSGTKRKGGLRLDNKADALTGGDAGPLFVAGKSAESLLLKRVVSKDADERMPQKAEPLSAAQVGLVRDWIDQGAKWPDEKVSGQVKLDHWSFHAPARPGVPEVKNKTWIRNPIDAFTLARMEANGYTPSPEADRYTLIRRASLDLIGLPPSPEEADAFANDKSPDAYEKLVDRLLASPHYGERWGRHWLDLARYADTNGYEKDLPRSIWPYRDWVINALNKDMPFDQFTVEQLAGDMLPNATQDQKIATGFHRNTMINEEGGIDVEEFRYESVVDRVKTTGTVWLGLTVGCAQCHTHKYDPITQREYYQFMAFLNNADEPDIDVRSDEITRKREEIQKKIEKMEAEREQSFPARDEKLDWEALAPATAKADAATLAIQKDNSVLAGGNAPDKNSYKLTFKGNGRKIGAIRLEALTDPSLPHNGPGRAPQNGNFVLVQIEANLQNAGKSTALKFSRAEADASQNEFDVNKAIGGKTNRGWAIDVGGKLNVNRTAIFYLAEPAVFETNAEMTVVLDQSYGSHHTLGKFRISIGIDKPPAVATEPKSTLVDRKFREWENSVAPKCAHWTVLAPDKFVSRKNATMTKLDDRSILLSGDRPNNDTYDVECETNLKNITAIRLEVLPHESLPENGPGRATMFSVGDFMLTEFEMRETPRGGAESRHALQNGTHDFAASGRSAAKAADGVIDSGWSIGGATGKPHEIVFELKEPANRDGNSRLKFTLVQFYIHYQTIGRFRISVTSDALPVRASGLPAEIEEMIAAPTDKRPAQLQAKLRAYWLSIAPELASFNKQIEQLRKSMPKYPTTMVMEERSAKNARTTKIHHRGEFLSTREAVEPGVPAVLHAFPEGPRNRLTFAKWLIDKRNPLVGRVTVNRIWQAYFGKGIVSTVEDFGLQSDKPSNPQLLDWLATEFAEGWSLKRMHKLILTSATYRQGSRVKPELLARDLHNDFLARAARLRVEGEAVRDISLAASGLLNLKIGGPSVHPPQPDGVMALAYGGGSWPTSSAPERYRRGLYTYLKRTVPYPGLIVFDAPPGDSCCARRNRTNTPLGALTLLNDEVYVEASRALALRVVQSRESGVESRARIAFRLCATREPDKTELEQLVNFYNAQLERMKTGKANAKSIAGKLPGGIDANEAAAWTVVSRALLNLDETITRE